MSKNKFYLYLLLIAVITSAIIVGVQYSNFRSFINPYIWFLQGYLITVTTLTYYISTKGIRENLMDFQNFVMASIGIRFFLSAIILILYIYKVKEGSYSFLINFFVLYLCYTVFEIKSVLTNLRAHLDK